MHGDDTTWIQTYTGKQFWPLDPRAEDVDIEDIAHALAVKCRFTGHCREFYSIAQHSCLVAMQIELRYSNIDLSLTALLHDAAEAYTADIARPVKKSIAQFSEIEHGIEKVIAEVFDLHFPFPASIKWADNVMLATDRRDLMADPPRPWTSVEGVEPLAKKIEAWDWRDAERKFLDTYERYLSMAVRPWLKELGKTKP